MNYYFLIHFGLSLFLSISSFFSLLFILNRFLFPLNIPFLFYLVLSLSHITPLNLFHSLTHINLYISDYDPKFDGVRFNERKRSVIRVGETKLRYSTNNPQWGDHESKFVLVMATGFFDYYYYFFPFSFLFFIILL